MNNIIIYLIIINLLSYIIFGFDKYKAIKNKYRIPERLLILNAFLGGSLGSILGMITFHHKTKKIKFIILIPLFLIIQIILILYIN